MVFPLISGEILAHAHASYSGLSLLVPGLNPYKGRVEERVQGLDKKRARECKRSQVVTRNDPERFTLQLSQYATITATLRALTKKETPWQRSDEQQHAFDKLKDSRTKSLVMSYFNPAQETEVIVDASTRPVGREGITSVGRQGYQLRESSTQRRGNQILANGEGNANHRVGSGTLLSLPLRI